MEFVDFVKRTRSSSIELLFPGWQRGENVAFLSPHDDDVILGAGYLLAATLNNGGTGHIFIFCRGDAGYSSVSDKATIVERRKKEALDCYRTLGVPQGNIHFLDVPDFSLMTYVNRRLPQGDGLFEYLLRIFREKRISRVVFSNGYFEHWDHTAVFLMGTYTAAQAGDPILADLGDPSPIKSHLMYSVWGDFEPDPANPGGIDVDKGILADDATEHRIRKGIETFSSQKSIIQGIIAQREKRKSEFGYLELYKTLEVRKPIDFQRYIKLLNAFTTH